MSPRLLIALCALPLLSCSGAITISDAGRPESDSATAADAAEHDDRGDVDADSGAGDQGVAIDAPGTDTAVTADSAAATDSATTDATLPDGAMGDATPEDADGSLALVPDFGLEDVNPNSSTYQTMVSPRDHLGHVSAWYFGHT